MPDHQLKWLQKAEIDYFSPFVSLWLACNSWYNSHYAEIGTRDRDKINKIKHDTTARNLLKKRFDFLIDSQNPEGTAFRSSLEQLLRALDYANINDSPGTVLNFDSVQLNMPRRESLKVNASRTKRGAVRAKYISRVIDLGTSCVISDKNKLFAGVFEILYQVRCMLVHGSLEPKDENHAVVRACYQVLWEVMHF